MRKGFILCILCINLLLAVPALAENGEETDGANSTDDTKTDIYDAVFSEIGTHGFSTVVGSSFDDFDNVLKPD